MKFVRIDERKVYEMVFQTDDQREIAVQIDRATRDRLLAAISDRRERPITVNTSGSAIQIEYSDPDPDFEDSSSIMADMNDRLASLGLPIVGEEESDGVDQI